MISEDIAQEILHTLFSSLEALETQTTAILQFLKDKGIASEEELTVHFKGAGNASNVRWRATRVRIDHLLSSVIQGAAEKAPNSEQATSSENSQEPPAETARKTNRSQDVEPSSNAEPDKETHATENISASGKSETKDDKQVNASAMNDREGKGGSAKALTHAAKSDSSSQTPGRKSA